MVLSCKAMKFNIVLEFIETVDVICGLTNTIVEEHLGARFFGIPQPQ